jgi:protease-4
MPRPLRAVVPLPLLAVLAASASAEVPAPVAPALVLGHESVASVDFASTLLFNPAALGARYPGELAVSYAEDAAARATWRVFASSRNGGLAWSDAEDGERTISAGLGLGEDPLRLGWATAWRRAASGDRVTDHRIGALSRPAPWLSLGAAADHVTQPHFDGRRLERAWALGAGLRPIALARPLAHGWGTRLTFTADVLMAEGAGRRSARVRLGGELEPVPGFVLRAAAEDHGGFHVGLALLGPRGGWHGQRAYDRDGEERYTTQTISIHEAEDRSAFASRADRRVAVVRARGFLGDEPLAGVSIFGAESRTPVAPIHAALERALEDPLTRGVLLDVAGLAGLAQIDELRPRVQRLRAAGKPVVAWLERGAGRGDLMLAAACDRIVAPPEAMFGGLGLRAERRYYRRLLERWGVRVDRSSIGPYKSAYRAYSEDSLPPADREVIEHNLDRVQELFVSTLCADRPIERERLLGILDGREWPPGDLARAGLIDSVGYREDALALLGELAGLGAKPRTVRLGRVRAARREWTVPARLAVVYAAGDLEPGTSGNDLLFGPTLGAETLIGQIERAFRDRRAGAVVLRVESPGGSSLAADLVHHALVRMKRETRKPLVVSMGGVAASGGYHIASPGDRILAGRFTSTGSIGVVFVKPSLEGWYAKHDVRQEVIERGAHMRGWSLGEDWDAAAQASADSAVARVYRGFVSAVARGRGLPYATVDSVAQGRVWLGADAVGLRLVDRLGGLEEAIEEAGALAGVPEGERIRPLEFRRPRPGWAQRLVGRWVSETLEREARLPELGRARMWDDEARAW